ncbi:MAG: DUF1064 domain-containing protein [Bryobacteraceae bacterium]
MNLSDLPRLQAAHKRGRKNVASFGRGSKMGNKFCVVEGIKFRSKAEGRLYPELLVMQRVGSISNLRLQTRWPIEIGGVMIGHYVSDFDYIQQRRLVVVDIKGQLTQLSAWKLRLMKAVHGVDVRLLTQKTDPRLFK